MILEAIEAVIDFVTLRSLWKKKPAEIESAMKAAYAKGEESKRLEALAAATEKIEPPQASEATRGK